MTSSAEIWNELQFPGSDKLALVTLSIGDLNLSGSPRQGGESDKHIRLLAEAGDDLPPILVHAPTMRIIDGVHRVLAAKMRGEHEIQARLFDGDEASSFVLSVHTNTMHGLPLSVKDRKAAAQRILEYFPHWSDRAVASVTGLAHGTVAAVRRGPATRTRPDARIGRDGRRRPRDSDHRRELAARLFKETPEASLRQIAERAGISPETARSVRRELAAGDRGTRPRETETGLVSSQTGGVGLEDLQRTDLQARHMLRADPAFRSTESGRALLRLLSAAEFLCGHDEEIIAPVPDHCLDQLAGAARVCAQAWLEFAQKVEGRDQSGGGGRYRGK